MRALLLILITICGHALAAPGDYVIIVNAENPVTSMSQRDVSKLFLKKTRAWPNDVQVAPVDLNESSAIREVFSKEIHKRPIAVMQKYWLKQAFSGKAVVPPQKDSDAEVILFVAGNPGGIGYVDAGSTIPDSVKVLKVE